MFGALKHTHTLFSHIQLAALPLEYEHSKAQEKGKVKGLVNTCSCLATKMSYTIRKVKTEGERRVGKKQREQRGEPRYILIPHLSAYFPPAPITEQMPPDSAHVLPQKHFPSASFA